MEDRGKEEDANDARSGRSSETRRFLISRLSSLGDVVCSLPAAAALKKGVAGAHVTWAVEERFADVVRSCSAVDEVVLVKRGLAGSREAGIVSGGNLFEAALDLQGLLKSALVIAGVKARRKVGFHWQREGSALFSRRVLPDPSSIHVVDQYVDVARAVGGQSDDADFSLNPSEDAVSRAGKLLAENGLVAGAPFVVINPGSARAAKRWPVGHYAGLIDGLDCPAVLIGSKGEESADQVVGLCKAACPNLAGRTTIAELIALIGLARAHVGGDTGSTHIAAALSVPAIGIYSATRPERSCPYGQISRCHYDPEGLERIGPEAVLETVKEAIA